MRNRWVAVLGHDYSDRVGDRTRDQHRVFSGARKYPRRTKTCLGAESCTGAAPRSVTGTGKVPSPGYLVTHIQDACVTRRIIE